MERAIKYSKLPWGIWWLERLKLCRGKPLVRYKGLILFLTFCSYTTYHLCRVPFSVVKISLCPVCANCSVVVQNGSVANFTPGWPPFNDEVSGHTLLGSVDYSWLFAYALTLYFSGFLADRVNLRIFLTIGMLGSALSMFLMGVAYFAAIHSLAYFILVQVFGGIMQSTGWPGVVAIMSHWFGKHNRGLIMGVWNSHTSVGNILGRILPSFWAECREENSPWGWSFILPGVIMVFFGYMLYFFLVNDPTHVGLPPPTHHLKEDLRDLSSNSEKKISSNNFHPSLTAMNSTPDKLFRQPEKLLGETGGEEEEEVEQSEGESEPDSTGDRTKLLVADKDQDEQTKPINFFKALLIPGVVEYSLSLFFNKLVSYTFLFWLPFYIKATHYDLSGPESDWLSALFDVGGIAGGIICGVVSDKLNARAFTCGAMLLLAIPFLFILREFGGGSPGVYVTLLIITGALINGPYGIVTTAVSSDLGTHPSLKASTNAKATVTAIIDGTGSMGAAVGPLLTGLITDHSSWSTVFYFLMACTLASALFLGRIIFHESKRFKQKILNWYNRNGGESSGEDEGVALRRLRVLSEEDSPQSANHTQPSDPSDRTSSFNEQLQSLQQTSGSSSSQQW